MKKYTYDNTLRNLEKIKSKNFLKKYSFQWFLVKLKIKKCYIIEVEAKRVNGRDMIDAYVEYRFNVIPSILVFFIILFIPLSIIRILKVLKNIIISFINDMAETKVLSNSDEFSKKKIKKMHRRTYK